MQTAYPSVRPFWFRFGSVFILGFGGLIWILLISQAAYSQSQTASYTIWYVKANAAGSNGGNSWEDAFTDLQDALAAAQPGDEIWVAAGLYKPTDDETDREATFQLLDDVAIYGGFAGHETTHEERDWETNITVLSGDIDDNDLTDLHGVVTDTANIVEGNSYHVVTGSGVTNTAVLDGFFITAGLADGTFALPCDQMCGGGMYNYYGHPLLINLSFTGNGAFAGGGLVNIASNPVFANVLFLNNSTSLFENNGNGGGGGMANWENSNPILNNVFFSGNTAAVHGGGMVNDGSSPTLTNVSFINNSAIFGGGMSNGNSNPILTAVSFISNSASHLGGGIANGDSNPILTNVTFVNNSAGLDDDQFSGGGGMINVSSSPTLTNVSFYNNSAVIDGGGMANREGSSPTLIDVHFSGNIAAAGGGMSNWEADDSIFTNMPFTDNTGMFTGGSIYTSQSSPILTNVLFSGNTGLVTGGGLYNRLSSPVLTNVSFVGNNSVENGGGMTNVFADSHPVLTNVAFSGNRAGQHGGGIYSVVFEGKNMLSLSNVSLSGNSAGEWGGAIFNHNTDMVIQNSIIWSNQDRTGVGMPSSSISNTNSMPTISYSLIQGSNGSGDDWNENLGIDLGNNLDADPLFINPPDPTATPTTEGNLRLLPDSPAVDAGNNVYVAGIETDLDGNARIVGPHVDLGPYEVQPVIYTITHQVIGDGSIELEPDQASYLYGEIVTVTAVAMPGWTFAGWQGDLSGDTNPVELVMDDDKVITATFSQDSYSLTVHIVGEGSIELEPDQASYLYGEVVTVTAVTMPGWIFAGWQGDLSGDTNPVELVMDDDKVITAVFIRVSYTLYLPVIVRP